MYNHCINCGDYMWIYEHQNWPNFIWDSRKLASKLIEIRHQQGLLIGKMLSLGFENRSESCLNTLTSDVVKSSAIESESLNSAEVRSSIARRLGMNIDRLVPSSRAVDGVVDMMLDATQAYSLPLTKDRLFAWHTSLFPLVHTGLHKIVVGDWRSNDAGPMQVVSGPVGREQVHFEAPPANTLEQQMNAFLNWFNEDCETDPVLKAGIAHLWFVTIHPFEDGNGRIARAISDMALARADGMKDRFYSLSTQIEIDRKNYYFQLEKQQKSSIEITEWLDWFLASLGRAFEHADRAVDQILFKARLWDWINQSAVNSRQRKIINLMLRDDFAGFMNTSKYAKLVKCSSDTALRDIQELKKRGIIIQNIAGGRSTSYRLLDKDELYKFYVQ